MKHSLTSLLDHIATALRLHHFDISVRSMVNSYGLVTRIHPWTILNKFNFIKIHLQLSFGPASLNVGRITFLCDWLILLFGSIVINWDVAVTMVRNVTCLFAQTSYVVGEKTAHFWDHSTERKKKRVIPRDLALTRAVQVIFEAVVFLRDGLLSYIIRGFCAKNTENSTFHVQSKGKLAHLYVDTNVAHSAGTALHTIAIISFSNVGFKPLLWIFVLKSMDEWTSTPDEKIALPVSLA